MSSVDVSRLQALGAGATKYDFTKPDPSVLEKFENPAQGSSLEISVHIECPEFTSLCPKTGQPDFATIVIDYTPREWCVESKSLKLYLMGFRMHGEFHESCCHRIATDLVNLLDPNFLRVEGKFTPRGGIPFWPKVAYFRPGR